MPGLVDPLHGFFAEGLVPSPELNEIYELRLAKMEEQLLTRDEIVDRGGYFVGVDGVPTNHFRICTGGSVALPPAAAIRLQSFLNMHRFKSSYATHGLFPYRGKFHPQMVKAIINVMGVSPGETVLDPMAGSGTTAIEAAIMGVNAIAFDVSPFCELMMRAKLSALSEDVSRLHAIANDYVATTEAHRRLTDLASEGALGSPASNDNGTAAYDDVTQLAFMDARGYSNRSRRKDEIGLFREVIAKYSTTISRFRHTWPQLGKDLGKTCVGCADARQMPIDDNSVDGVVFSPPYSFAIDYVENDLSHLAAIGCDVSDLRGRLIGLRGKGGRNRADSYFGDMDAVLAEIARVLRTSRYCAIVVGSNTNQLAAAYGLPKDSPRVQAGIESRLTELGQAHSLKLELRIRRLIVGMANSMRYEHILFFRKH